MILITSFTDAWKRVFDFKGITDRRNYWYYSLSSFIFFILLEILESFFKGITIGLYESEVSETISGVFQVFSSSIEIIVLLIFLGSLIVELSICVRRLRDVGKSWKNIFWSLLPIIGWFRITWFLIQPSVNSNSQPILLNEVVESFVFTWRNAFDYVGVSNRTEFWFFVVPSVIVLFPLSLFLTLISHVLMTLGSDYSLFLLNPIANLLGIIGTLYIFGSLIVFCSLSVRRLRDLGKSWYWVFVMIIPIINLIPMFAWCTKPSLVNDIN